MARAENPGLTKKVPKRYHPTARTFMVSWKGNQNTTSKKIANRREVALYCNSLARCRIVKWVKSVLKVKPMMRSRNETVHAKLARNTTYSICYYHLLPNREQRDAVTVRPCSKPVSRLASIEPLYGLEPY